MYNSKLQYFSKITRSVASQTFKSNEYTCFEDSTFVTKRNNPLKNYSNEAKYILNFKEKNVRKLVNIISKLI